MTAYQVTYFTVDYFLRQFRDGLIILYCGLSEASHFYFNKLRTKFCENFHQKKSEDDLEKSLRVKGTKIDESSELQCNENLSSATSSISLIKLANGEKWKLQQASGEDDHPATLHYSFVLLSKMLTACLLYIPAFTLNLRFGSSPSRLFIVSGYLVLVLCFVVSFYMVSFAIEPSVQMFAGRMNINLKRICVTSVVIGQIGYITCGLFTSAYVLYQRQFLQNFIYHRCPIITLARSYQRHQMVYLFIAFNLFSFMSEPLFALLGLTHHLRQPIHWPSLEPVAFKLCKCLTILGFGIGALMISSGTVIIPLITCFLIMSFMEYLKNLAVKQSTRCSQTTIWANSNHNKDLLKLLNSKTRNIMTDFACETLTMDWPIIIDVTNSTGNLILHVDSLFGRVDASQDEMSRSRSLISVSSKSNINSGLGWLQDAAYQADKSSKLNSSRTSSLMFLYKNLIKSLSELKCVIQDYERKFGNFHQISNLLACLVISLWVTSALTEIRHTDTGADAEVDADTPPVDAEADAEYKRERAAYTMRVSLSTVVFALSNVFVFLKCDCLTDRITKIKSQLFKMNIDLACGFISAQQKLILQNMLEQTKMASRRATTTTIPPKVMISSGSNSSVIWSSSSELLANGKQSKLSGNLPSSIFQMNHRRLPRTQYEHYMNHFPELDQIWSMYDQVNRISSRVNFRFTSTTYYSKKCMLLVFGRAVSLILFYIQIIDMYSS